MGKQKKIIHVDMDAFYVSVEIRDNPSLAGKPVAVGGRSDRRGVLSTCNYIARQFGVSSAMPTSVALRKCPNLVVVPGRMHVYQETSQIIRQVFKRFTDKIEPLSLDEAYLDVTDCELHQGSATLIAEQIRQEIFEATGLTASAGIAPIKFLAKIASDQNKPNGQFTITPNEILPFIKTMPLKKIPGVGKVTAEKLTNLGLSTGADIQQSNESFLAQHFGKYGYVLWNRCQGIDPRVVEVSRIRKSIGVERTFEKDISDLEILFKILNVSLLPELNKRCESKVGNRKLGKRGVKIKFSDFQQSTKELKYERIDEAVLQQLMIEALDRGNAKAVRLLGIHVGLSDQENDKHQLDLGF